jgi:hypothetical protein
VTAARSPLILLLLAAALAGFAESALDLSVTAEDLANPVATVSAGLDIDDERLLDDAGALRWEVEAAGSFLPVDGSISGSASALLEASLSASGCVVIGRMSGSASGSSAGGAGPVTGSLGASLVFDGEAAGFSIEPWVTIQGLVEPYLETGLTVQVSVLAGSLVLEPAVSAGLRWDSDSDPWIQLEPGLALAWYPGIPLTLEAGFRWAGRIAAAGGWESEWAGTLSLSGALGGVLLFTGAGSLGRGPDGTSGDASAELAIVLGAPAGVEISLPIRFVFSGSDVEGFTVGAGAGLRFSW